MKARPQVPAYLRRSQQLLRCCMSVYADVMDLRTTPLRPVWDVQAVKWGSCLLYTSDAADDM
eukprot:9312568-Alexandrium_andersonii.AAC.1